MKPTRRLLGLAVLLAVSAVAASACDTSPVAASAAGQEIKQSQLNEQLRQVSSNRGYVALFDANQSVQTAGLRIPGDASGTFGANFVAESLTGLIRDSIERKYLAAHHDLPSPGLLGASGDFEAAIYGRSWLGFPASYRIDFVRRAADLAQFVPVSTNLTALHTIVSEAAPYLFTQVCVRHVAVSVDGSNGRIDFSASLAAAEEVIQQSKLHAGRVGGGSVSCYTPSELQAQDVSFFERILHLRVGQSSAAMRTSFGYSLDLVTKRAGLRFDSDLERAASLVLDSQGSGVRLTLLGHLLSTAQVTVDPQYGTWNRAAAAVAVNTTLGANAVAGTTGS